MSDKTMLEKLSKMLTWKKSKKFYAEQLGITLEEVNDLIKEINKIEEEGNDILEFTEDDILEEKIEIKNSVTDGGNEMQVVALWDTKPASPEEIEKEHKIDTSIWQLDSFFSKWDGKKWQVTAKFKRVGGFLTFKNQKDIILTELKEVSPARRLHFPNPNPQANKLLEISIFDPHFGKLAWGEETGDDYDIDIAEARYKAAVVELISQINVNQIEKIHLPLGNDLFNIDSMGNTTTAGTSQDSDSRFAKMVRRVKRVVIETINSLAEIAPVEVTIVPGNHDLHTTFMLGEILEAYYHNTDRVNINNSAKTRKFFHFGQNSFMYTHGNDEKHADLPLIFATENPKLWAETRHRFIKVGHFHKNKKVDYISIDDYRGAQVQILPSLSGTDYWHYKKGYLSNKQAKAFLYDKERGEIASYTYTV